MSNKKLSQLPDNAAPNADGTSVAAVTASTTGGVTTYTNQIVTVRNLVKAGVQAGGVGLATVATTGSYTNLTNVPATFPPSSHTHTLSDVTNAGTIATQNANAVAITGGSVNSTTIGATTASTGAFTTLTTTSNVGVGTASPINRLHVVGDGLRIDGNGAFIPEIRLTGAPVSSREYRIGVDSSQRFYVGDAIAGTYRMAIESSGFVGIGTASPTQRLDVWGAIQATANVAQARLVTASGVGWRIVTASSGTTFDEFLIQGSTDGFATVAATPLRISTAGNVGIGTGTPAARLDVRRTNNYTVLGDGQFTSAEFGPREQNDGFCSMRYSWATYGSGNNWAMDCGSDRMTFAQTVSNARTEWMTLRSSNLGIGTNNPTISSGVGLHIGGSTMRLGTARTPASSTATGNTGEICWDSSYLYVCVAANSWRRIALTTF